MGRLKEVLTGTIGKCFLICDVCYFSVDFSQSVWPEKRGGIGKEAKERPSFEPIAGPHRFSKLINCTSIEILYMLYLSSETVLEVQENPNIVRHEWSACASSRPWARDGFPGVFTTFVSQIHKCKYRNTNTQIWAECLYWVRCWPPGVWYLHLQFHSLSYCRPNIVDVKIIFVLTITQNFSIYLFATLWLIFVPKLFISFQILFSRWYRAPPPPAHLHYRDRQFPIVITIHILIILPLVVKSFQSWGLACWSYIYAPGRAHWQWKLLVEC